MSGSQVCLFPTAQGPPPLKCEPQAIIIWLPMKKRYYKTQKAKFNLKFFVINVSTEEPV